MIFPLAVSSLNNVNKLKRYNYQLTVVEQFFASITATQNMGYYNKFDSTKSMGAYCYYVKIPQCGYMEHGLKILRFLFK